MDNAFIGLIGVIVGAGMTNFSNFFLEGRKHNFTMEKHVFDIKRQKLEEMFLLLRDISISSKKTMNEFMNINISNELKFNDDIEKSFFHKFTQLRNYVNMYFYDDLELNEMLSKSKILLENTLEINGKIFTKSIDKINDKALFQKLNTELLIKYEIFNSSLLNIEKYLPEVYKKLITKNK